MTTQPNQPDAGTQTPRNAKALKATSGLFRAAANINGFSDFARQLERELTAAQQENERLREALERIATYDAPDACAMIQQARSALTPPANPTEEGRK